MRFAQMKTLALKIIAPYPTMNVKRLLKIDIVYVFHCCALADLPRWIKQSLQQRVEDWKQRSKTLVDQIHEVDPYYIPTNEYRFIGQASYADIAAGRTNSPSSRNCSPYRQREVTPPTMTAQVLPAVMQTQKLTMEHPLSLDEAQISKMQIHKNDTNINKSKSQLQTETRVPTTDDRNTIGAEECQQAVSEVELSMPRRGRSPTRKTSSSKVKNPKIIADQEGEIDKCNNLELGVNSREETQTEPAKNSLAPCEERRGRSPSPMWVPGSTSYADILRGCIQTTQITAPAQPPRQKMVSLSEESRRGRMEVSRVEEVTEQDMTNAKKSQQVTEVQQIVPTQEIQAENMQIVETYSQPETEKTEDQNYTESEPTNWTDESLQDYNVLQHVKSYENVPQQQPTEIYDYMIPETMPELVGFIGSHLGTYPVSSYVYAPSGHHQQVQQLDQINLNPYDNSSLAYAPEHYVAPTAYLSASDIYQQTPMQEPVDDMRHTTAIVMEKPVEVPIIRQSEVPKDASATELIDKPEQQKSVNISNVETSTTNKTEGKNTSSLNNMETKGQTFSYAQILSHGLSPRITSTRIVSESTAANYQSKERSDSPKESLELPSRELSPLQEPKFKQESPSFAVTSDEQSKQSKENDWDTMKKREVRKRYQHSNDKIKQTDEKKSRKPIDKSKEKQKNEKLTPPKKLEMQDESFLDKINDRPMQKEEKVQQEQSAIDLDTNPSQEKKRRQKKKKIDKSVGDEIDKALKEIEDMDKQKIRSQKDKFKEQNKEIKSRDSVNETIEQHNDEKQSKSDEKSRKSKKSKEATRIKETIFMEHAMLPSEIKANDKNILKDDVEDKKDTKDAKVSDSKCEEKVQKDITKEMSKELQLDNNSHINSNKLDNVTKCKNKIDKDTKIKEQNGEASENKMQYQSDVLSNNKKDKINIVDENNVTKDVKLLVTQKIELEDINEKTSTSTKIENKKHKDASKKEKNKTKSKEIKLEAENSNINQEKLEISTKEIIEDKSLKSIKPLTDIEIKDSESKTLNITKIASDVNESKKNKTNPRKKDKASKNKIKSEAIIDPSSIISTSKVLDEIKINVNGTEKYVVSKSEQMIDGAKIAEATVVQETTKEILLPETVQQTAQEIVQIDKTYDSVRIKESKETEQQTNAEVESFTVENLEIDTMDEKEAINYTKVIEKTKKPEVEKCQIKTTKQKKSEKTKSNIQDTRKENRTEIPQHVENKIDKKEDELNIEFLIVPSKETIIQDQFSEKTNVAEQHESVLDNSCLVQSKTDTENNHGVKIDKEEDIVFGQVNISTEKPTVPETDLAKPTIITKNVEIISTTETLPEESEVSSEISNIVSEEKYRNIKNGKFDHHKETMIENKDIKTDINDKNSLLTEDIKKSKDIAPKEKMSKRTKKKEHLSPKHAAEQTKQSFYDKFQEEIVFKHDSTKKEETPKFTNQSLPKIDNVDNEKTQESSNKNETETEFDSKVSSDSVDKAQVYKKYTDETHNNLESEQPSSIGKALIIEKMITTVTTTTSVPGSVKVKPPDVKSIKSVEIIENIPLPKIVGSKVIELITLRPETVEASLTTTYARVPNDSLVNMQSDQAAISQKVGLTSAISTESNVISDEMILFGSVQDRRRVCSSTPENRDMSTKSPPMTSPEEEKGEIITQLHDIEGLENQLKVEISEEEKRENEKENTITTTSENIAVDTILTQNDNIIEDQNIDNSDKNNILSETSQADSNILIENDKCTNENEVNVANTIANNIQEKIDTKTEFTKECESEHTIRKVKSKEIPESSKIKKEIVPEHLLDLIKPYAMDRHAYNHAESNFHRYFKVVKTVKKVQPAVTVHTRPESIERIVQDSIMKPIDVKSSNQEMNESNYRRHAFIVEAPKYPITSFYEFESQWIKMKFMPEKSVSISSDDSQVSVKTAIEREKQIVNEKEAVNVVSDFTKDTIAIVEKLETIETNDNEDKDKKSKDLQQSVHLVSDDSWMSILDEPMMIEDDFDDTFNSEENTIDETVDTKLIDIENQYRTNEVQIQEKRLSENISEVVEIPSCIESIEEIREPTITLVSTSANNTLFNNNVKDLISITNDSILQSVIELNVSAEPSTEKISNNQLTDAEIIIDTNIQENKTDIKNNIETDQEIKEKPTKISSVHLESDDAWMALLEEEITIDDDFDELETIKDSQIKKREEDIEIKKAKTKQQIEEKEIKKKKSIIEKQEATVEQKKESIIEEQQQKIEKETIIEKPEEIKEKNVIEKYEEDIETKEQKIEILNDTSLTEIAVKDEYHTNIKDIKNETVMNEKQNDKTKNQPRKKKELKHAKVTKTKDQAKTKTANKQSNIKTDIIKDDLSLQSNLEEHKLENKSDCKIKETEKSLIIDKQQVELHKDKEECEKREERKPKSKKSKKQNQRSEVILKEKSALMKCEDNLNKDDSIVLSKAAESDVTFETSSIVENQQESKDDMPKYDSRLNPNAKSWAAIVGKKGTTETTVAMKDDFLNTQTSAIIQDTNDNVINVVKQAPIEYDSCEIPSKEETLITHLSSLEKQNDIEELKATVVDEIKPIEEKSTELLKQLKESNKSYAQVTASSRRTSPQISQEETYSVKTIPLKTDYSAINVKTPISNEMHEDFITEELQSPLEQDNKQDEMVVQSSDYQTVITNLSFQEESIPWVEEVEKETMAVSTISVDSINTKDNETYVKSENTWAAIVGKKSIESSEVNDIINLEQREQRELPKPEQNIEPPLQVQIYVEEAPKQEPIENLVQVDEQGFIEFVNRKELRSRRSRSRSRNTRQDKRYANKEIKTLDIKSENSEDIKAKEEIENKIKQSVQKTENEQRTVDENDELTKIMKEENAKSSKSRDEDKQKNDSNENTMQFAENKSHIENKIIQETKPSAILKGKKIKSKNKAGKDYMKQQSEVNEHKELKHIEKPREDKSANENKTEYNKIQSENIEDQSIKEIELIKDTEHAQENKCKDIAFPIINQDNTKSKKKKNKKGKFVIEELSESTFDIDKKTAIAEDLKKKTELPVEPKLDEVKLEAVTIDMTCNILTYPENEEIPAEKIKRQENIKQVMIPTEKKTTEKESIEQKKIDDESKNAEIHTKSYLEKIEKNITEEKEIPKFTKAEKRKQKKKIKIAQSKFTDLSEDINTIENIKIEKSASSKDKIDDESIIEIQSVQREEIEKSLEKFETVNETSLPHITSLKDKQKTKSKSKSKKEKRQQDDKSKSQNFTTTFITEPKEIETLSIVENTEVNLSKDIEICDITQTKEENIKDQILNDELAEILQPPKNVITKDHFSIATETIKQEDIKELKENVLEAEEILKDIMTEKTEIDLPQTEESNNICLSKSDNILKLHDITINNDSTKIESVLISDKINDEIETETPVNYICMQKELPCNSVNTAIKHSLPSNKLSSTVQQFEDEDKLKRIASTEQENSDILVEPSKSKVQFYIADEILVLTPDRRKHVPSTSFLQEQSDSCTTDSYTTNSWFLSIDDGFWPDKRPYHEAERDHFENLALHTKKNLSHDSKRDSDDRPQDHDDDNSGGGSGGSRSWDSCGNSCSLLGTPQTERMIADLPGGICSWSDYSTYLSSESERIMDHNLLLGTIEDPTLHSSLSLDNSLPNKIQSSSPPSQGPQTESCMESLANVEITPREYPVSSSNSFRSSNDPSTCTKSSSFTHLPQSKLHLGKETREGSVQRCSPNGEVERETAKGEAERIRRIQVRSPSQPVLGLVLAQI